MILTIRKYGDPVLRKKAAAITRITPELTELARDMIETMREEPGVGLAAPQVGESIRLMVFEVPNLRLGPTAYINPEIIATRGMVKGDEGCLSIPEINGEVSRHQWVKVKAQTLDGKEVTVEYEDLPARVMQHEMDHLDGVLFVDRLNPIKRALIYNKLKKLSSYDYTIS
jgi:peptide deformylase